MKLSKYLSYAEGVKSQTATRLGINNTPDPQTLERMKYVASEIFDKVREHVGGPLAATSFYRSHELNKAIGGATSSQHCKGEAIDIDADVFGNGTNKQILKYIKDNLEFDQLINEFPDKDGNPSWVHVSKVNHRPNRFQILTATRKPGGGTDYSQYVEIV